MAEQYHDVASTARGGGRVSVWRFLGPALISSLCLFIGVVVYVVALGVTLEEVGEPGLDALIWFLLADLILGVAACIAVGAVRNSLLGNVLIVACGIISVLALPAWLVAARRIGERRLLTLDLAVIATMTLGATGMLLWQDVITAPYADGASVSPLFAIAIAATITGCALLWGRVRGMRAALIASLREQAKVAEHARAEQERTREAEKRQARFDERRAVARDMHDGISHQLSIIAMHAGALASRDDLDPGQLREASCIISGAAREAGSMLRDTLTALRDPTEVEGKQHPTLKTLSSLLADAASLGTEVIVLRQDIEDEDWENHPAQTAALLRILEEVFVNATKHAAGEAVRISLRRNGGAVTLNASNRLSEDVPAEALGTGNGLIGVAERAAILGGHARSNLTGDGRFEVEVDLPWK